MRPRTPVIASSANVMVNAIFLRPLNSPMLAAQEQRG
jgi:hypothetical protein